MKVPWIVYGGASAQLLPLVAAGVWRRPLSVARKWMLCWCAVLVAGGIASFWLAQQNRNNHWLSYVVMPVAGGIALWTLSLWQVSVVTPWAACTVVA